MSKKAKKDEPGTDLEVVVPQTGEILTRKDLRNRATDSWTDVLEQVGDLAGRVAGTDFVPDSFKNNVPAVAATILRGREIGFEPMTALSSLHSIKGRVGLSAEAMRALVLQAGHEIVTATSTSQLCKMKGRRRDSQEWTEVEWTIADARQAGLLGGKPDSGWNKYPRQMLQARASAELCRLAFPDVIAGLASVEELQQYDVLPGAPEPSEGSAATGEGSTTKVKRARKKPAAKVERAETPEPELPGDEADQTGAESAEASGTGSAPDGEGEPTDSAPPELPEDEPTHGASSSGTSGDSGEGSAPSDSSESPTGPIESIEEIDEYGQEQIVDAEIVEDDAGPALTQQQRTLMLMRFHELEVHDRDERLHMQEVLVRRELESSNDLNRREAGMIIDALAPCKTRADLDAVVQATEAAAKRSES